MEERGAKYIIVSAGSPSLTLALTQPDKAIPDYLYLHFSFQKAAREALKPETIVIGSGYSVLGSGKNHLPALEPEEKSLLFWSNKNIDDGITDMVAFGRQSYADPQIPIKLMQGKEDTIKWCIACDNCVELLIRQVPVGCTTFDREYTDILKETREKIQRANNIDKQYYQPYIICGITHQIFILPPLSLITTRVKTPAYNIIKHIAQAVHSREWAFPGVYNILS